MNQHERELLAEDLAAARESVEEAGLAFVIEGLVEVVHAMAIEDAYRANDARRLANVSKAGSYHLLKLAMIEARIKALRETGNKLREAAAAARGYDDRREL